MRNIQDTGQLLQYSTISLCASYISCSFTYSQGSPRQILAWGGLGNKLIGLMNMATKKRRSTESMEPNSEGDNVSKKIKKGGGGFWNGKLLESMKNPDLIISSDELTVSIKDAYPKAKYHFLVLPKEDIPHLRSLNKSHLSLLQKMLDNGILLAEEVKSKSEASSSPAVTFRYGYHASPSMMRLHMHVISQDFDSTCLKNKKHWNSFTSDFFLDAEKVMGILKDNGKVDLDVKGHYEPMLKLPLKCHICHAQLQNMLKLKDHLRSHL